MRKVIDFKRYKDERLGLIADEMEICSKTLHCMANEMEQRIVPGLENKRGKVVNHVVGKTLSQTTDVMDEIMNLGSVMNSLRALLADEDI